MIPLRYWLPLAPLICACIATQADAHEFWLAPAPAPQKLGETVPLRLEVGEFFEGDAAGFSISRTARMRHYTAKSQQDLKTFLSPGAPEAEVLFSLDTKGHHLFAFDSEPLTISLSADRFHAYLHDEGLDFVKTLREKEGTASQPGRERYRRNVKTLILVDAAVNTDRTYALTTGQRLELTPQQNPFALRRGQTLGLKVAFDGKPLGSALVKAWHKRNGQLLVIRARTTADGTVTLDLPFTGAWMLSVVHMVPATDPTDADWDSYWGNLSFTLPESVALPGSVPAQRIQRAQPTPSAK